MVIRMPKLTIAVLTIILCFGVGVASANPVPASLTINGYPLESDVPPFNMDGRLMVPARAVTEALGGSVEWIEESSTVLVYRYSLTDVLALRVGETEYHTAKTEASGAQEFDRAPVIIDGRTLVPVRLVSTFLGADISWDDATKTAHISGQPYTGPQTILPAHEAFASGYRPSPEPVADTNPPEVPPHEPGKTPILGRAAVDAEIAAMWAKNRGATDEFVGLAEIYWALSSEGGARPDVAYAQAAKETGFGRFGGLIDATYCNPCGLKKTEPGPDSDRVPEAHQRFDGWQEGILAHLHHLELYAGKDGVPYPDTPDPRHFPFLKATALYVEDLGGKWAPSPDYGTSIVERIDEMVALMRSLEER